MGAGMKVHLRLRNELAFPDRLDHALRQALRDDPVAETFEGITAGIAGLAIGLLTARKAGGCDAESISWRVSAFAASA
jgi:hypothetical protein